MFVLKWGVANCQAGKHGKTNEGAVGLSPGQHTSLIDGGRLTYNVWVIDGYPEALKIHW